MPFNVGGTMRARIIIEYEPEWTAAALEHLGRQRLQHQEEQAWMTGAIRVPSLRSAAVKFELLDKPSLPKAS